MWSKNYRLQSIQFSKNPFSYRLSALGFQLDDLETLAQRSLKSEAEVRCEAAPSRRRRDQKHQPTFSVLRAASCSRLSHKRLVENTGLEPVTSWLQTRRSPS
jgi:hypothetical protein